jgi:hypothetical protein
MRMSELKPAPDTSPSDESAVAGAVAVLADAAEKDPAGVKARLQAAGFEFAGYRRPQEPRTGSYGFAAIGKLIAGKGIFVGGWEPKGRTGRSLGQTFYVLAAPQDLTDASGKKLLLRFDQAVEEVASRNGGRRFGNEIELCEAIEDRSYRGEWFIPPREVARTLYDNKDRGALKGTFTTTASYPDCGDWYWSSTEYRGYSSNVWTVRFSDGNIDWNNKADCRLSCRPCCVLEVSHFVM